MKKIIVIILVVFMLLLVYVNKKDIENNNIQNEISSECKYEFDEETLEYIIYNSQTGEEIIRVKDEESMQFYKDNPDYNPKTNAEDPDFIDNSTIKDNSIEY